MNKNRLEAFSDGVIAIIITIMILELKVPHNPTWRSYLDAFPIFSSYAISFVFIGMYWSAHHHLFNAAWQVNNKVLWINIINLFFLSFLPFTTATVGENSFSRIPVIVYAAALIPVNVTYIFLVNQLCNLHGSGSDFSKNYKGHLKSYLTITLNAISAVVAAIGFPKIGFFLISLTALMWFIPNHHIENKK
jgi:uncharacterized membrane protein